MHYSRIATFRRVAILSTVVFVSACSDLDAEARKLFNQGMTLQQEGKTTEAKATYKKVVELYPQTQTAVEANKLLLQAKSAQSVADLVMGTTLLQAQERTRELQKDSISGTLDVYRLDTGRYPTTEQGLEALIKKPSGVTHWNGPYVKDPEGFSKLFPYFEYKGPAETTSGSFTLTIRH